jgi:hypothetical protein
MAIVPGSLFIWEPHRDTVTLRPLGAAPHRVTIEDSGKGLPSPTLDRDRTA